MKLKLKKKMGGFVQTAELVLISTVLVTGLTVGLVNVRDSVNAELEDVAEAVGSLDQSYVFNGIEANSGGTATNYVQGSKWLDTKDSLSASGDEVAIDYARSPEENEDGSL